MKTFITEIKLLFFLLYFHECLLLDVHEKMGRILSFQSCQYDVDCIENSFCSWSSIDRGKCRCKENYVLVYNKTDYQCLQVATGLDSNCVDNIQCEINLGALADCDQTEKKCKCINTAHLGKDLKCHKSVGLGDFCDTNDNCLLGDGTYGYCYVGQCVCNTGHHISVDSKRCIRSAYLEEHCESMDSCVPTFSTCDNRICKCITGYIESNDNRVCLKAASAIGDNCTETIQCSEYIKGSFCDNNKCVCKSNYHGYGNECVVNAKLGDRCNDHKECIITANLEGSVRCTDGLCICEVGVSTTEGYGCIIKNSATNSKLQFFVISILIPIIALVLNK